MELPFFFSCVSFFKCMFILLFLHINYKDYSQVRRKTIAIKKSIDSSSSVYLFLLSPSTFQRNLNRLFHKRNHLFSRNLRNYFCICILFYTLNRKCILYFILLYFYFNQRKIKESTLKYFLLKL